MDPREGVTIKMFPNNDELSHLLNSTLTQSPDPPPSIYSTPSRFEAYIPWLVPDVKMRVTPRLD